MSQDNSFRIYLQANGRWGDKHRDLTCGDRIELLAQEKGGMRAWLKGRIEHNIGGYFFAWEDAFNPEEYHKIELWDGALVRRI